MTSPSVPAPALRRCLGPVAVTAQAVGTVGLTLTAVINIPQVAASAGHSTALCYAAAFVVILLVSETMVMFQQYPAGAEGIAGYVRAGLGSRPAQLGAWTLLLGYGATLVACLAFLGFYVNHLLSRLGLPLSPALCVVLGGGLCVELARRDVRLSTTTMLFTEAISVTIVLGVCALVLQRGGASGDLAALNPAGDSLPQLRGGLMAAVLSFIGFESAATLGDESLRPQRAVPQALRRAVLLAGGLFLFWAVVISEGLRWLPLDQRSGLDPISLLADQLGHSGAGELIKFGAFLCLIGTCVGCCTALGRISLSLAREGVLPKPLAAVHPRFCTPAQALWCLALPLVLLTALPVAWGVSTSALFSAFGSFSVIGFLLVYALVAAASLASPLAGVANRRRWLVGGAALMAVVAVGAAFISGLGGDPGVTSSFAILMVLGGALVFTRPYDCPAEPDR